MTYSESVAQHRTLNARDVAKLIIEHNGTEPLSELDRADLEVQCPLNADGTRNASDVLAWLGY